MQIEQVPLGGDRCYVIAELGHNHQGDLDTAVEMVEAAASCGADAVKLQKRHNRALYTKAFYESAYTSENAYGPTYGSHREYLEFGAREFRTLVRVAKDTGISLIATAFDHASVDFLVDLDIPAIKIASGDLTNLPLIHYASSTGRPLIISTGGGTFIDVADAVRAAGPADLGVLQCTAMYPAPAENLDLKVIETYRRLLPKAVVGASLHYNGVAMALAAYALGARIIEQHFTLDRTMKGTDHAFSLEPQGLAKMVRDIRRCEEALGDGVKKVYEAERPAIQKMSKAIYTTRPLRAGDLVTLADVTCKSPGVGLPPSRLPQVIGHKLLADLDEEVAIESTHIAQAPVLPATGSRSTSLGG